jgi:hypothetical protein
MRRNLTTGFPIDLNPRQTSAQIGAAIVVICFPWERKMLGNALVRRQRLTATMQNTDDHRMRTHLSHTVHASCPGLLWDVDGSCQYNFSGASVEETGSTPKEACNDGSYAALATRQPSIYRRRATRKPDPAFLWPCHAVRTGKRGSIRRVLPDWCIHPPIANEYGPCPAIPAAAAIYSSATPAKDRFRCGRGGRHAGTSAARFNRSIPLLPASGRFPSPSSVRLCSTSEC